MSYKNTQEFSLQLDEKDELKRYRNEFHIPLQKNGQEHIYLCGNSLGLQAKRTKSFINQELEDWATFGVEGHFHAKNPWLPYHEFLAESYAKIVGAKQSEVVAMNTLTVNLHLMLVSFYRPTKNRHKIIIEADAFPSDIYAVESQIKYHGLSPDTSLIKLKPRVGESAIRTEDIEEIIHSQGEDIALIMLGGVNYYTGQVFDFERITKLAQAKAINVGFDLAHGAGNVKLELHNWGVDFAIWCSYKYLNSGPGSVAGAFVHEKHHNSDLPRFAGWWGHNKESRFKMPDEFNPIKSVEGWQLSNPPILSLAAIRASLSIFDEVGMEKLVSKSKKLTDYLVFLLNTIETDRIEIITPKERGCQISIRVKNGSKELFDKITAKGVVADWREPDVIRVAPVPLYNSFSDVFNFYNILKSVI
ncbi:MAG: kynureninase [Bacteroidetes bacterium]|jgi:kynureninase|nr:MAG: kynureninase [Cryomorphaceae bacterium BACL11 MAG-121015-bin20]MBC8474738.1 kynureninase [Cryomorphaceae bacterium]MDA0890205.1 kynureninase [Bacteroidota bacterium]